MSTATPTSAPVPVAIVTLGCARNEVDSEELAARLEAGGFTLVSEPSRAAAVLVNTCGFVEAAKKDSIDTVLAAADLRGSGPTTAVVAVGCLAERYGADLAAALPEADAVLGFDAYPDIAARLRDVLAGHPPAAHTPVDRRRLLPVTPVARHAAPAVAVPGHGQPLRLDPPDLPEGIAPPSGPRVLRRRLDGGPVAPLKLASGCDRRCTFCAIPSFRGSFLSRPPDELVAEAAWLVERGVREIVLVSENSTSYGKDLGDLRALEKLLPRLAGVDGVARIRVSYLQPAELRPSLVDVLTATPGVAPYFDISFQHASAPVLRAMRRFGDPDRFLELIERVRAGCPQAGIRSNFIVGFPGETAADFDTLRDFLGAARLDAIGVFGYSDEDGTAAAELPGKLDEAEIRERAERLGLLAEELVAQRARSRVGERVDVLVEQVRGRAVEGRAAHQAPEVDGSTRLRLARGGPASVAGSRPRVGDLVPARVVAAGGVDLVAEVVGTAP